MIKLDSGTKHILYLFILTRILLALIAVAASSLPDSGYFSGMHHDPNILVDSFIKWDAEWYVTIATYGYNPDVEMYPHNQAFFPLYPTLMRAFSYFLGTVPFSGIAISNLSLLAAIYFLYKIAKLEFNEDVAKRSVLYFLIFPTAFFLSSIYSEGLFLALAISAFYFARKGRYDLAGALGFFAALTRPVGVFLVFPLAVSAILNKRKVNLSEIAPLFIIPLGLLLYALFLWHQTGDMMAFLNAQENWERSINIPFAFAMLCFSAIPFLKENQKAVNAGYALLSIFLLFILLTTLSINPYDFMGNGNHVPQVLVDFAFCIFAFAVLYPGISRLPVSLSVYSFIVLLVPLATQSLMSFPRFALSAFPIFIVLGILGKDKRVHYALSAIFLALMAVLFAMYANWYWVA